MPKASDLKNLNNTRQKIYRALHLLYKREKASPSLLEISEQCGVSVGNLGPEISWLVREGWVGKKPGQHRSLKPLIAIRDDQ